MVPTQTVPHGTNTETKRCGITEETFWRILEESCRAAGHRLRLRSLSPSHPFLRYVAEMDRWVPIRAEWRDSRPSWPHCVPAFSSSAYMHATPLLAFSYILHQAPAQRAIIWASNVLRKRFTFLSLCMVVTRYDSLLWFIILPINLVLVWQYPGL